MSLLNETSTVTYDGNNSDLTGYEIPFPFFQAGHLMVTTTDAAGKAAVLHLDSGFRLVREDETSPFTVVTTDPVPDTSGITITRKMPLTQTHEYMEGQRIPMGTLERSFDWIVMQVQWLWTHFTGLINDRPTYEELGAAIEEAKLPPGFDSWPKPPIEITVPPADGVVGARQTIHVEFPGTVGTGGNITVYLRYPGMSDLGPYPVAVQSGDSSSTVRTKILNGLNNRTAVTALASLSPGGTGTLVIERKIEADYSSGFGLLVSMGTVTGISYSPSLQIAGTAGVEGTAAAVIGQFAILTMPETGNRYTFVAQSLSPMRWGGVTSGLICDEELPGWKTLRFYGTGADRTTEHVAIY